MRPDRTHVLMQTAYLWAERGTCDRLQVGAVFHRDGRILVQGYNGAPAGLPHCNHECDCPREIFYNRARPDVRLDPEYVVHRDFCNASMPCTRAVHAEQNGIAWAARLGVGLGGASVSVTHQPCLSCANSLINAGIISVDFVEPYRLADGLNLLHEAGIEVSRIADPRDRII